MGVVLTDKGAEEAGMNNILQNRGKNNRIFTKTSGGGFMEALRITQKITSDHIEELNCFKGQNVEIIIIAEIEKDEIQQSSIFDLQDKLTHKIDATEY